MKNYIAKIYIVVCLLVCIMPSMVSADDAIPSDLFTALMVKTLNYDQSLVAQDIDDVFNVAIVYDEKDANFVKYAALLHDNIQQLEGVSMVFEKTVVPHLIALRCKADKIEECLGDKCKEQNISAIILLTEQATEQVKVNATTSAWLCAIQCRL